MPNDSSAWEALNHEIIACRKCPRLVAWREEVARVKRRAYQDWEYWGKPVPAFGDRNARLLIVGLAPGAHGSNRTGRMFTGDASGDFLFAALHRAGFASQPKAVSRDDPLSLKDVLITATCRCVPPDNKPTQSEMDNCRPFLQAEVDLLPDLQGIVALGQIGFRTALSVYRQRGFDLPALKFGHGVFHELGNGLPWLVASYHPSQQNTQTGRLTPAMFDGIWQMAREKLV
ncbi:uracil-DNA glycosylase [Longilinea arvoryzae]|uniref:Type-5 uracil-DNA glycosylase n=1 Tax=Longilinea arvoryzae TaxID=360412 RepID=A0A0S7BFS6_9CHLR|nr:uracil-DNA glycosylase [Longilinea arvoryzae]GAP14361.1 uracil-DNA glycosylase [Longilinea arvoryzae]